MSKLSTFERVQAPAVEAPEPHTPGPFVRHGVMVRDTVETTGGMFCIRQEGQPVTINGKSYRTPRGDVLAYAYTRADADLMAAAPGMLAVLETAIEAFRDEFESDSPISGADFLDWFSGWRESAAAAMAAAKGVR